MIRRDYRNSSSFKVATLFAILLAVAVTTLCISIYLFIQQTAGQEHNKLIIILSAISVVSLLAIAAIGYLISIFVVTRINRIADTAQEIISTGDLTKRIDIDSRWDDLSFLGNVLNEMLDKIATLMEGVQHITDTVAHDLRTPLARLRNKLERASMLVDKVKNDEEDAKASLVNDVDNLLKTFNSILSLSSLESGRQGFKFELFDLEKVVQDAIDLYMPLAEEKHQSLQIKMTATNYLGDKNLIFQVIANLLDNAIKFTQIGGVIQVTLEESKNVKRFMIADNGPGISDKSKLKVFDRFYRDQNQKHIEGSGLGLSLVQAVLKLHGASINMENNQPGLKVVLTL